MKLKKNLIALLVLVCICFASMFCADLFQRDFGKIDIETGTIETELGDIYYKLYKPEGVSSTNKAPAVLLLHGYQNDHETCAAYGIELARRGYVAMAIDEYGHGLTDIGLAKRGSVNHKVTVNYGLDSEADKTYVTISGAGRYKIMMNFSNLSFFKDRYSKDTDGNSISDSSCGGISAYAYLSTLDYVDNKNMCVTGHSMGTWSSWSVAAAYSGSDIMPKATVLQCGELFSKNAYDYMNIKFNNVLLLQAKYDEFSYFRDYENTVSDELLSSGLRLEFMGQTSKVDWNKTYGDFNDGSARRMQLLMTNHRLTTHNKIGLATALEWFDSATGHNSELSYGSQIAGYKELLTLVATLCAIFSMLPLMNILLATPVFSYVAQNLPPKENIKNPIKWLVGALITIVLAGASFPFMTQLGHGLLPLPEGVFRMTIGNGFISWYGLLIIIMIITHISARRNKKHPSDLYNLGLSSEKHPERFDFLLFGLSLLLAVCMVGFMYAIVFAVEKLFTLDLRYIWPMFKTFTGMRAGQFAIYIGFFAAFYIFNNSKIMAGLRIHSTYGESAFSFVINYLINALVMIGGVLLVTLIEYIPFFGEIGPGADLLFGSTFGGPFMSLLILFLPQVLVFAFICTYCYRKTGNVYTGALVAAMLACWIVTGGSSFI